MAAAAHASTPPAVAPPPGHPRFPLFDSLRAIAALSVLVFHAAGAVYVNDHGRTGTLTSHLSGGVTLFFLISGFLIYRPFVAARFLGAPRPGWPVFLRRRFLRIVPGYWFALTIIGLIIGYGSYFWSHPWTFYGFGQVYRRETVELGLVPAWTLCIEVSFYLLLPLWALAADRLGSPLRSLRRRAGAELLALGLLGAASAAYRVQLAAGDGPGIVNLHLERTILATFLWFALGMGLALASVVAHERGHPPLVLAPLVRWPSLSWAAAIGVFGLVAYNQQLPGDPFGDVHALTLVEHVGYGVVSFLLLVPAVFEGDGRGLPRRVLGWRVLAWLGLVSYAIYLWHTFVVTELHNNGLQDLMPGHPLVLFAGATLVLSVACAAVSYYLVERPLLRFKG